MDGRDLLFGAGLVGVFAGLTLIVYVIFSYSEQTEFQYDITVIRAAQHECLKREPNHSFSLVHTQGGYLVQCEPIKDSQQAPLR
jgi:hypothetical protein